MAKTTALPAKDPAASAGDQEAIDAVAAAKDADLGEGAGNRSLEDLASQDEDGEGQQLLDFGGTLNLTIRGKKPTDSQLKIKAISRDIVGQLGDEGDDEVYTFVVRGRLDEVNIVTKRAADGAVSGKVRRGVLTPISMVRVTDDQLAGLEAALDE